VLLTSCSYTLITTDKGVSIAGRLDNPHLPPLALLRDSPPWVWDLIYLVPSLVTPGSLNNTPLFLAKILYVSDKFTVLDLLETTDDEEYVSMRQIHRTPWQGPAELVLAEVDFSAPLGEKLEVSHAASGAVREPRTCVREP